MSAKEQKKISKIEQVLSVNRGVLYPLWIETMTACNSLSANPGLYFQCLDALFSEVQNLLEQNKIEVCGDSLIEAGDILGAFFKHDRLVLDLETDLTTIRFLVSTFLVPMDNMGDPNFYSMFSAKAQRIAERAYYSNAFLFGVLVKEGEEEKIFGLSIADYFADAQESEEYGACYDEYVRYCIINDDDSLEKKARESVIKFVADLYSYVSQWNIGILHHSHKEIFNVFLKSAEIIKTESNKEMAPVDLALELLEYANMQACDGAELRHYINKFAHNIPGLNQSKRTFTQQQLKERIEKYKGQKIYAGLKKISENFQTSKEIMGEDIFLKKVNEEVLTKKQKRKPVKRKLKFLNEDGKFEISFKPEKEKDSSMVQMTVRLEKATSKISNLSINAKIKIQDKIQKFFKEFFDLVDIKSKSKNGTQEQTNGLENAESESASLIQDAELESVGKRDTPVVSQAPQVTKAL